MRERAARRRLDAKLAALQPADRFVPPARGWVRAVRDALGMTQADLGRRLGVSAQAVSQLEAGEVDGTARLASLRRAAEAMNCTLVYALVPRTSLESTVTERARRIVAEEVAATERAMALEAQDSALPPDAERALVDELVAAKRLWRR